MNINKIGMMASSMILSGMIAKADTFGTGQNIINIDFASVGNAGNGNDVGAGGGIYSSSYGGVPYDYRLSKYEISQTAINAATANGLVGMPVGTWVVDQPAASINWFQAAGFVNWMNTSTGHEQAYQLNPTLTAITMWSSADAWQDGGENLYRNKDAYYFMPSEDEWYKAAYHKNDGVTANYWDFPTKSNNAPVAVGSGTVAGSAVYHVVAAEPADVSNAGGLSAYETMGQGGNVWEWMESAYDGVNNSSNEYRSFRGGCNNNQETYLRSSARNYDSPIVSDRSIGVRVASVPEPSTLLLTICTSLLIISRRRPRVA